MVLKIIERIVGEVSCILLCFGTDGTARPNAVYISVLECIVEDILKPQNWVSVFLCIGSRGGFLNRSILIFSKVIDYVGTTCWGQNEFYDIFVLEDKLVCRLWYRVEVIFVWYFLSYVPYA